MFQMRSENDVDDGENSDLSLNIGGKSSAGGKIGLNTGPSKNDIEIDVNLKVNQNVSDIDVILGGQEEIDSDLDDKANANIVIGGTNGLVKCDDNIDINVGMDIKSDVNLEVDTNINQDIEIDGSDNLKFNNKEDVGIKLPDIGLDSNNLNESIKVELPDIESKKFFEINKDIEKIPFRDPDIHIRIDMDERNKTANFVIDMPDHWSKKLLNKWDEPKFRGDKKLNGFDDLDINEREKERLDVEINMFIGKENLEDSTVYAVIRPLDISESDDYSRKFEFNFQMPKFELPKFSIRRKSSDTEVQADLDGNVPDTERHDFRYQLPKVQFPSFKMKEKPIVDANADIEVDGDPESPTKRHDFRFKFPKIDFSKFGNVQRSGDANADIEDEIRPVEAGVVKSEIEIESPTQRYDFRIKWPKIEFPSFGRKGDVSADASLDVDGKDIDAELNVNDTPKRYDFRYQLPKVDLPKVDLPKVDLPKVEFPTLVYIPKSHNAMADIDINNNMTDINADLELEAPSGNLHSFKRPDFRFQFPTIDFTVFKRKHKSGDVDVDVDVHVDMEEKVPDGELESPTKRHDFRYQFPKMDFPSFRMKGKENVDESDVEGKVVDGDVDDKSHIKRHDFSFKLPKLEFSLFGNQQKSANADAELEVTVDEEEISPVVATAQKSEMDIDVDSPTKKNYFSINMPKFNFPSFRGKEKVNVEGAGDIEADVKYNGESTDLDDDERTKRHDFRFQLPKVALPSFNLKQKIDAARNFGLELGPETRRYDFTFAFPDSKFSTSDGRVQFREESGEHDSDYNEFSVLFDEGDSSRCDENIFKVQLKNGVLKCKERHCGEWQHETDHEVICYSPKKNWLVVFLPKNNESEVVVVFNEEVILKYQLEACINTLQSFDVEGSVKIHEAKLFGE